MVGKSINVNVSLEVSDPKIESVVNKLIKKGRLGDFLSNLLVLYNTGYLDNPPPGSKPLSKNSTDVESTEGENLTDTNKTASLDTKTLMDTLNVILDIRESTVDILEMLQSKSFATQTIIERPVRESLDNVVGLSSTQERATKTIQLDRPKIRESVMANDGKVKAFDASKFAKLKKKK